MPLSWVRRKTAFVWQEREWRISLEYLASWYHISRNVFSLKGTKQLDWRRSSWTMRRVAWEASFSKPKRAHYLQTIEPGPLLRIFSFQSSGPLDLKKNAVLPGSATETEGFKSEILKNIEFLDHQILKLDALQNLSLMDEAKPAKRLRRASERGRFFAFLREDTYESMSELFFFSAWRTVPQGRTSNEFKGCSQQMFTMKHQKLN